MMIINKVGFNFILNRKIHFLLIVITGLFVYSNTFTVPFVFDDYRNIVNNPEVKSHPWLTSADQISGQNGSDAQNRYSSSRSRFTGYLTFALNYKLHGLDVRGYHVVNLIIHLTSAFLVYWLVIVVFQAPFFSDICHNLKINSFNLFPLFAALLFVGHPIQTQAVTYIVQRFASLATLFYLLSVVLYAKARLAESTRGKNLIYLASLITAFLAMTTKENTFTLPFALGLYEVMFFNESIKRRIYLLAPFILVMLFALWSVVGVDDLLNFIWSMNRPVQTPDFELLSPKEYLFTQFRVMVTYMRLLLLPVGQNLDYDYPIYRTFSDPEVFLSFLFFIIIIGAGIYLLYRSDKKDIQGRHWLRLISFGVFWFFITLSIESSIIPIKDVIYEHRLYLPSVGFFVAFLALTGFMTEKLGKNSDQVNNAAAFALFLAILILSITAFTRNAVWRDRIKLWEDVVSKSSGKSRPHIHLGVYYYQNGRIDEGVSEFYKASKINAEKRKAIFGPR